MVTAAARVVMIMRTVRAARPLSRDAMRAAYSSIRTYSTTPAAWSASPPLVDDANDSSGEMAHFHGIRPGPVVHSPTLVAPQDHPRWPILKILEDDGVPVSGGDLPELPRDTWVRMYEFMLRMQEMDVVFYGSQRQGRISFYMTTTGEEAAFVGSAAALTMEDCVFGQYRETGVIMWRGFTLQDVADQLFGNENSRWVCEGVPGPRCMRCGVATEKAGGVKSVESSGIMWAHGRSVWWCVPWRMCVYVWWCRCRGRSMPMLFGSKDLNFHTMSAPLATQIPQAAGAAFAMRGTGNCVICYFGEGAASEGDFHAALNFSATLECPIIYFVRNNGYAIRYVRACVCKCARGVCE